MMPQGKRLQDPGASHNAPRGLWGFHWGAMDRRLIGCFLQQGGSRPEELVPRGAWSREVFGHLRLVARKSPHFLRDGPY
jgi:hypothetical protein